MTRNTYADVFWGGDLASSAGFEALVKRDQDSKRMFQDLEDYLKKRSKLEAEYSKSLSALTKCFSQREDLGVIEASLNKLRSELDTMAQSHSEAATHFLSQAEAMKKFREDQCNSRKSVEDTLSKSQNQKFSQLSKTRQLEKAYVRKCVERDCANANFKELNSPLTTPKDLEKAKNKAVKAQGDAEKSDDAYKCAVMVLDECRIKWENDMLAACQTIQELDKSRLMFIRQELWVALNTDSKLALEIDYSCESVREILEKCDIVSDIQAFIAVAGTGTDHPEPFRYKHYTKVLPSSYNTDNIDNDSIGGEFNPYSMVEVEEDNTSEVSSSSISKMNPIAKVFGKKK